MTPSASILTTLKAFAQTRHARGDKRLTLQPAYEAVEGQETGFTSHAASEQQGLVLEPYPNAPFEARPLKARQGRAQITTFCDGTRTTYFVGHEDVYPVFYSLNASVVRTRDEPSGYHKLFLNLHRRQETLLAPFGRIQPPAIRYAYESLGLCPTPYADLCWSPASEDDTLGLSQSAMDLLGNQGWQIYARRRARRLLDISEQIITLAAARILREADSSGQRWLLKDGSLFQMDKVYLRTPESLRNVVSCVKTHPVPFFGVEGERTIAQLAVGERSPTFLPRPIREAIADTPSTLDTTTRPMISWYLRVQPANPHSANLFSGIVRLDMAAVADAASWVDEVSWAVLDEFYGLSARPDPRHDVMPYGIYDCETFLKAHNLPGDLLLAQLM